MKTTHMFLVMMIICALPSMICAGDQQEEKRYQIGSRTAILTGEMRLSGIDPLFNDLSTDGLSGAHHSGIYILYSLNPYVQVGFETLVGNSDAKERTTMNFQAAGPVMDIKYGNKFFVAGGMHAGGIIANALYRSGETNDMKVNSGTHYKGEGVFLSPYLGVGLRFGSSEIRLLSKPVYMFSPEKDNLDAFNAVYSGISWGLHF